MRTAIGREVGLEKAAYTIHHVAVRTASFSEEGGFSVLDIAWQCNYFSLP
jgi:hypothetical protein